MLSSTPPLAFLCRLGAFYLGDKAKDHGDDALVAYDKPTGAVEDDIRCEAEGRGTRHEV
jgi:hypothetical protein